MKTEKKVWNSLKVKPDTHRLWKFLALTEKMKLCDLLHREALRLAAEKLKQA